VFLGGSVCESGFAREVSASDAVENDGVLRMAALIETPQSKWVEVFVKGALYKLDEGKNTTDYSRVKGACPLLRRETRLSLDRGEGGRRPSRGFRRNTPTPPRGPA